VLDIEQSGIYLNGSLCQAPTPRGQELVKQTSLSGQFSHQQLSLAGTVPSSTLVSQARNERSFQDNSLSWSGFKAEWRKNLQVTLSGIPEAIGLPPSEIPSTKTLAAIKALNAMPWY